MRRPIPAALDPYFEAVGVIRERHCIFVDGTAPIADDPEAPSGYDFDDPDNLEFWWSQGAIGLWQINDVSLVEAEEHRLFDSELVAPVKALVDLNGGDPVRIKPWLRDNHAVVNFGHAREANSYLWRGEHVAMASVLDYRFGQMRDQLRAWQARIDASAYVFTRHPAKPPPPDGISDDAKPGYWTGEASAPRSARHERTSIHIYQPAWDETNVDPFLWALFGYQPETHAFVPQENFHDVARDGNWTFLRKGKGYLALWSWRAVDWRTHEPPEDPSTRLAEPFDLVATGGADNVWNCEAGDAGASGSFDAFMGACRIEEPAVRRYDAGFEVAWRSPSAGPVSFGSTAPFIVDGDQPAQADFPRHELPLGTVDAHTTTLELHSSNATLVLDTGRIRRVPGIGWSPTTVQPARRRSHEPTRHPVPRPRQRRRHVRGRSSNWPDVRPARPRRRAGCSQMTDTTGERPNIVLLVADDHGREAVGCYGNPVVSTPSIDALAATGVLLAQPAPRRHPP